MEVVKNTYEFSEYQKKPYDKSRNFCSQSQNNDSISYAQFFNNNFQNSVRLSDFDDQMYKNKLKEENQNLQCQLKNLSNHINNLNNQNNDYFSKTTKHFIKRQNTTF